LSVWTPELIKVISPLVGVLIGGFITWYSNRHFLLRSKDATERETSRLLLGELSRVIAHYRFVQMELPDAENRYEPELRMKLARYGSLRTVDDGILRLGYLSDQTIEKLLDLNMRIRNADLVADALATRFSRPVRPGALKYGDSSQETRELNVRAGIIIKMAVQVVDTILKDYPKLALAFGKQNS